MNNVTGAASGPLIDITEIDALRTRAMILTAALVPYVGHPKEDAAVELRQQVCGLANKASLLIAEAIRMLKCDGWYRGLTLGRNHYHYKRQADWTGSDDEDQYVSYVSSITADALEIIWEPNAGDCWSPTYSGDIRRHHPGFGPTPTHKQKLSMLASASLERSTSGAAVSHCTLLRHGQKTALTR